ncbi:hypothetical protein ACO0LV_17920 [Pseudactinotalea sp. Z1739]|uniref:hypothetical protein n=1 Tax=Pseudactinotalea sp. Z1739 TaxID=3413028 RepID=UPI003C7DC876
MIVQPTFYVPSEIAAGILSGELVRYGGVVRDTAGRLVTHLKEVPTPEKVVEEVAKRAALSLKNPWVAVGAGVLTLVAVGGGVVLAVKKRKKDAELDVPECVQNYNRSLRVYLEAIQNGRLDADIIDRLIADLDTVVAYGDEGDTTVAFSPDQLATLTRIVLEYTSELAKVNDIELDEAEKPSEDSEGGVVVDLRRYLQVQRRIFGEVA